MKKDLRCKKGETLHDWIERIAPFYEGCSFNELKDLLTEVSKTSYIHGSNDAVSILKDH